MSNPSYDCENRDGAVLVGIVGASIEDVSIVMVASLVMLDGILGGLDSISLC